MTCPNTAGFSVTRGGTEDPGQTKPRIHPYGDFPARIETGNSASRAAGLGGQKKGD